MNHIIAEPTNWWISIPAYLIGIYLIIDGVIFFHHIDKKRRVSKEIEDTKNSIS